MPWRETDAMEERRRFVAEALSPSRSESFSALCLRYGIARKTGYVWVERYRQVRSLAALAERSRRPRRSPGRTPAQIEARVLQLRRHYGWGGRNLADLLRPEGIEIHPRTIDRIIKRNGLIQPGTHEPAATERFERKAPNELWQMDYKGPIPLGSGGPCVPLSILDDHSRFLIGLHPLTCTQLGPARASLTECFERYGLPDQMLMDHGAPWWSTSNGHGLTRLSVFLIDQGIRVTYGRINHPQTQGKVERFHRTLKRDLCWAGIPENLDHCADALAAYRELYNQRRAHTALERDTPASRYRPSPRAYRPKPLPWDYPSGVDVRRLNSQGFVTYDGRRFFVCEALAGRLIGCQRFDETKLLVTYRHMQVREIDLRTGQTRPLVKPNDNP